MMAKRVRRHRAHRALRRFLALALGVLFLVAGSAIAVTKTGIVAVREITVSGNRVVGSEEIVSAVRDGLDAPMLGPIRGNLLLFPEAKLKGVLAKRFPRLSDIRFRRSFLRHALEVSVVERSAVGIYCRKLECFYVDRTGTVFAEAPETEGGLVLRIVDDAPDSLAFGSVAIDPDLLASMQDIWEEFHTNLNLDARHILRDRGKLIHIATTEGWEAILDAGGDLRAQLRSLAQLLRKELPPERRLSISSIDLRIPGRIFYR